MTDVQAEIGRKIVRRHPHVFADARVETAGDVNRQWEQIKRAEREEAAEQAAAALKFAGVGAVIAGSFARIFFRNAINLGLPAVVAPRPSLECVAGDELEIDLVAGEIRNLTGSRVVEAAALDPRAVELIAAGGLIPYLKRKYAA